MRPQSSIPRQLRYASILLAALGTLYLVWGARYYVEVACDLSCFWKGQMYVFRGKNPTEIYERWNVERKGEVFAQPRRENTQDPDLGKASYPYPPWSFVTGAAFLWPTRWTAAKWYYGFVNLIALLYLLSWVWRIGHSFHSRDIAMLLVGGVLATRSLSLTFGNGQYGILVIALLAGTYELCVRGHPVFSGLLLGAAMLKPTLGLPFFLPFLARLQLVPLAVGCLYLIGTSLLIWPVINTDPLSVLRSMSNSVDYFGLDGHSLINLISRTGIHPVLAMKVSEILTVSLGMALHLLVRRSSILVHFAIAGIVARFWTYHRNYDDLLIIFLLLAVSLHAITRRSPFKSAVALALGVSLWQPFGAVPFLPVIQSAIWVTATVLLIRWERAAPLPETRPTPFTTCLPVLPQNRPTALSAS